jgi:transposase
MFRKEERMHYARILTREGHSQDEIAKRLGVCDRMVRKYLREDFGTKKRKVRLSKLDPVKPIIDTVLQEDPFFNLEVLVQRLRNHGYDGGMSVLRDYAAKVRTEVVTKAAWRFETEPGFQAQVDWKECGRWHIDGKEQ